MDFWTFAQQFQLPGRDKPPQLQALIDRNMAARAAAEAYTCPNTKPEYGSKCSYLAGQNDDHTPCPGCPIFQQPS